MNLSKEFAGWNSKKLTSKAESLCTFLELHYMEIGHSGLDDICCHLFDLYHEDERDENIS